uniref:Sushi domain-containing protein n=1 Tax=Magallana gigas TaxID=29159 RepID=A0A8W8MI79_MAGGI
MLLFQIFRCPWLLITVLVPCYGSLKPGFSQLQRGHRLDRKLIQSFTKVSFLDCVTECMVTPRCKSVNYFKGANYCEINYENKTTAETNYMDSAGWVYSERGHWPKELAGACSNSTCEINQTCKHKRYSEENFFECVLSDCGIPDQKGINLNTTRREDAIGIRRRIHASCSDGYSQSGSGRLNCQSNGEWKYNIVCTDIDECLSNPCQNGGTCSNNNGSFTFLKREMQNIIRSKDLEWGIFSVNGLLPELDYSVPFQSEKFCFIVLMLAEDMTFMGYEAYRAKKFSETHLLQL